MFKIRSYEPERDTLQVYTLWQRTLGHLWPLSYEIFHSVTVGNSTYRQGDHFVAVSGEEIVGWIATQVSQRESSLDGSIIALLVSPAYQRRGVGSMLHEHALSSLKQRGVAQIQLGRGFHYFWQGIPANLPHAWTFFQACGWTEVERSFDLVQELTNYTTPSNVYERLRPTITISQAMPGDAPDIMSFEKLHFPQWSLFFQLVLDHQAYADVVVAREANQGVVGTVLVTDSHSPEWNNDIRWLSLLGESTGGIGTLGVAESLREQGIGLALAARVTEIVRERSLDRSYVGWTWLVDWYGKIGYRVWREYIMAWYTGKNSARNVQ
jgi:beta-N-acetylhexosaminidase